MASLSAWRTVISTISTSAGRSGSDWASNRGAAGAEGPAGVFSACWATANGASAGSGAVSATGAAAAPALFAFCKDQGDRGVDLHALGALRNEDFLDGAFIDRLDFHGRLVGFDFGQHVADLTVSPTLTSHLASFPSSMVGDRAGMRIWGMSALQDGGVRHLGHGTRIDGDGDGRQHPSVIDLVVHRSRGIRLARVDDPAAEDEAGNDEGEAGDDGALVNGRLGFPTEPGPRRDRLEAPPADSQPRQAGAPAGTSRLIATACITATPPESSANSSRTPSRMFIGAHASTMMSVHSSDGSGRDRWWRNRQPRSRWPGYRSRWP